MVVNVSDLESADVLQDLVENIVKKVFWMFLYQTLTVVIFNLWKNEMCEGTDFIITKEKEQKKIRTYDR